MMIRNLCIIVVFCTIFNQLSFAAQHLLKGLGLDKAGNPIPEVSVQIKKTRQGASTDENDLFSRQVPKGKVTLLIRHVGYQNKELTVDEKQKQAYITRRSNDTSLNEAVVVDMERNNVTISGHSNYRGRTRIY